MFPDQLDKSAIISPCGRYRYRLERECKKPFEGGKVFAFFGINPSTADAIEDDRTVSRWRWFTVREGGYRFIVGNVFSLRSTDVKKLAQADDLYGPDHWTHLKSIVNDADILVPCWGCSQKIPVHLRPAMKEMLKFLLSSGKPVYHFGFTGSGEPRHPLMLRNDTPLILMDTLSGI